MQTRLIRYFLAIVKERHFARAAESCGVSQPTLSAGLGALERRLGKRLVVRDRRFVELTAEGEALLPWARQMLAAQEAMSAAVATAQGTPQGEFRLGAIPAALPLVGRFARALLAGRPGLSFSSRSLTSREIARALGEYEIDGGLTYLDHEPPVGVLSVPLHAETYRIVMAAEAAPEGLGALSDEAVAALPLCLLHQGMQNRRILDARMAERGLALRPRASADSYVALLSLVQSGGFSTILPDSYIALLPNLRWARVLDFAQPLSASRIGLVVLDRAPLAPLASAGMAAAQSLV